MSLLQLGRALRARGYSFITTTPATHQRYFARHAEARDVRGVFGWNLPFARAVLDDELYRLATGARVLVEENGLLRATVRFSTLLSTRGEHLVLHSGYPTVERDAVFFGPDTYRFAAFLERELGQLGERELGQERARRIVEVGCGSGVASVVAKGFADQVIAVDINPRALEYAAINAELAGVELDLRVSDVMSAITEEVDTVIANPPYLVDEEGRTYRDGGGPLGLGLTLRILDEARAAHPKRLVIYTASPILDGHDPLRAEVFARFPNARYAELDPDVFGEDLLRPAYAAADRIAVIGLVVTL